jgi:hypothetical protein
MHYQHSTQKAFIDAVRESAVVIYCPPYTFRAGAQEVTVPDKTLTKFLYRLSAALSFEAYDRLTRAVWVAHIRAAPPQG